MGLARAVGAVVFSIVIGLAMAFIYRKEEAARQASASGGLVLPESEGAPQRKNGRMSASAAPGLGITPRLEVLGDPVLDISQ